MADRPAYVLRALELFADYGDREALVGGGRRLSYAQLRTAVLDIAAVLRDHGIRPGMTVAVLVLTPVEAPILQLALHLLGCRSAWVSTIGNPRREADEHMRHTRPDAVVYDAREGNQMWEEISAGLGKPVFCLGAGGLGPDLLAPPPAGTLPFDLDTATGTPESTFQTSGSTGAPKLILHRQELFEQVHELAEYIVANGEPRYRHLTVTPLWHVAGQTSAFLYLFSGGVLVVYTDDWDAGACLAQIERERISSTFVSPALLHQLLDHPVLAGTDCGSLAVLSVGAGPASPDRLREAVKWFGPAVRITYGTSESPFISALLPEHVADQAHPEWLRSCGPAYGDVRLEVRDEAGAVLPAGGVGELWAASRLNFAGYLGQPQLTTENLVDGWVRTGDIGYVGLDGMIYLIGRSNDMIKTGQGARPVYPRPIEDTLATHPAVAEAAVIGVPHVDFGETVHAYVVPAGGASVTGEELSSLVTEALAANWVPRSYDFIDRLPLLGIGKVDKKALRARYAADHAAS
jgi:fatty-acyl-CoA synthase